MIFTGFSKVDYKKLGTFMTKNNIILQVGYDINLNGFGIYVKNNFSDLNVYYNNMRKEEGIYLMSRNFDKSKSFFTQYVVLSNWSFNPFNTCLAIHTTTHTDSLSGEKYVAILKTIAIGNIYTPISDAWHSIEITEEEYKNKNIKRIVKEIHKIYKNIFLDIQKKSGIFLMNYPNKYKYYDEQVFSEKKLSKEFFNNETSIIFSSFFKRTLIIDYKNTIILHTHANADYKPYRNKKINEIVYIDKTNKITILVFDNRYYKRKIKNKKLEKKSMYLLRAKSISFSTKDYVNEENKINIFFVDKFVDSNKKIFTEVHGNIRTTNLILPILDEDGMSYNYYIYYDSNFLVLLVFMDILYHDCPDEKNPISHTPYDYFIFVRDKAGYKYQGKRRIEQPNLIKSKCLSFINASYEDITPIEEHIIESIDYDKAINYIHIYKSELMLSSEKIRYYAIDKDGKNIKNLEIEKLLNIIKKEYLSSKFEKIKDFIIDSNDKKYAYTIFLETETLIGCLAIFTRNIFNYNESSDRESEIFFIYNKLENLKKMIYEMKKYRKIIIEKGEKHTTKEKITNKNLNINIIVHFIFVY